MFLRIGSAQVPDRLGRFRQINLNAPSAHHDAIEFPGGRTILVTRLRPGLRATVLQLPVNPRLLSDYSSPSRKTMIHESEAGRRQTENGRTSSSRWRKYLRPLRLCGEPLFVLGESSYCICFSQRAHAV